VIKVGIRQLETAAVVDVAGEVDMATSPELRSALKRLTRSSPARIVVNLTDVDFMDSSGIATLVQAMKESKPHGGQVVLAAPSQNLLRVLQLSNLTTLFRIYATVDDAIEVAG